MPSQTVRQVDHFRIPTGATTTGWEGKPCYESGANEATVITDASAQMPLGIIEEVDPESGFLQVCTHGRVRGGALAGANIALADQRTANSSWACASDNGDVIAPTSTNYRLGKWDSKFGDPVSGERGPFFVHITGEKFA